METYWVWEYGLFEKNPKRQDSLNPETTLEVVKAADAQATIAALQARVQELEGWQNGVVKAFKEAPLEWSPHLAPHNIPDVLPQIFKNMHDYATQLTQRTAELEAANKLIYKKNCELGRAETINNDLQAELERVRGERDDMQRAAQGMSNDLTGMGQKYEELRTLIAALPKVEGEVTVRDVTALYWTSDGTYGSIDCKEQLVSLLKHRQGIPAHRQPNHFDLHVTHNGYQGYVITLAKDEIPLVIQALQAALTATSQPAKPQGRMHACDIPGCVSCGNPGDATSQEGQHD